MFNSAGLTAYYVRNRGVATAITLATLAAADSAYSSGGFKEVDATNMPGVYRLDVPDAAFATGVDSVVITLKGASGMVQVDEEVQLADNTEKDVFDRLGAPAGASVSADVAAVKTDTGAIKTKTDSLTFTGAGKVDASLRDWIGTAPNALISGRVDANSQVVGDKTGYALTSAEYAALVNLIWDELTSEARTAGSYGQLFKDNVNATISSRSSHSAADVWASATRSLTDKTGFRLETEVRRATAQAGAAGTITLDASASALDDFYNDCLVMIVSGTGSGQAPRLISDYVGATKVASVLPNWVTAPDATSVFSIIPMGRVDVGQWVDGTPNVLLAGRVDANAQAMANAVIAAATFAAGAIDANAIATDAIGSLELDATAAAEIADKLLGRSIAGGADGGRTVTDALRLLRNKASIAAGTLTVTTEDDTTTAWTAAVTTAAGNPISAIDPA